MLDYISQYTNPYSFLLQSDTPTLVQILPDTESLKLLPKKWKSFKLYLWCEGDSSLENPHPLDEKDHKGYSLPNRILMKFVTLLRHLLKVWNQSRMLN